MNEHVFGIIKRQWGFDHTLMKGLKKVDAETGIIFSVYNLRRIINIIGIKEFIQMMKTPVLLTILTQLKRITAILKKSKTQYSPFWGFIRRPVFASNNSY